MKNSIFSLALLTTTAIGATNAHATFESDYKSTQSGTYTYTFSNDETLNGDLGTTNHDMNVNGNGATLHGGNHKGMELKRARKLTVHNGLNFDHFESSTNGAVLNNAGTVEIEGDASFKNNEVHNTSNSYGGAVYNDQNGQLKLQNGNHTFENNTAKKNNYAPAKGGALYNEGTVEMNGTNTFNGNKSYGYGGAIHNVGNVTLDGTTSFVENKAEGSTDFDQGGAISNHKNLTIKGQEATFEKNEAYAGGAVYNDQSYSNKGVFKVETEETVFSENKAQISGGAIMNGTDVEIGGHATFKANEATYGGAISNNGGNVNLNDVVFEDNVATLSEDADTYPSLGGAINNADVGSGVNHDQGIVNVHGTAEFTNNKADHGGAIYNATSPVSHDSADASVTFEKDVDFSHNQATGMGGAVYNTGAVEAQEHSTFHDNHAEYGGAVMNYNGTVDLQGGSDFSNNTSTSGGGAVYNWSATTRMNGTNTFENNNSSNGGAIMNNAGTVELQGKNDFSNNTSTGSGGAVYNWQKGQMTLEGETTFTDNVAEGANGGAIYNAQESNIHIKGNAVFSGNRVNGANGEYNDIYNDGNIDVSEDSSLTLDGGVTGSGNLTFEDGSALVAKAGKTSISNHVTNKGAELTLLMENGYEGGTVDLIGEGGSLDKDFELKNNTFYDFTEGEQKGSYQVAKKSTDNLKDMLHTDDNGAAAAGALAYGRAPEENKAFNDMADAVFAKLQSPDTIQDGLDDLTVMSPEVADLVQQEQTAVSNQIFGAVGSRLSSGTASSWRGMSSGDDPFRDVTAWAQLLDNHAELDETSGVHGWDSDTYGIAFGLEKKINPFLKAGIGYAYGRTDIDGFRRQTDVYTNTGLLYGEYKPSNWFVNGIFSYGWSDYKEKKSIADYLVRAKYDVNTLGMQVMTGYEFWAPYGVKFVPELGMRYLYLDQDDYTDSLGIRITGRTSDVLTAVFGAKISQPWVVGYRTIITPELRIATTYDMKRPDADSVVSLPNGQSYEVSGRPMKRLGVEIGAGVTAEVSDKTDVSANYEGHFRDHYQDHTGLLSVKYKI